MNAYESKFHDGFVDGFFIRETRVIIFIRTAGNEPFALVADNVTRMRADNLREGNLIFDIVARQGENLTRRDVDIYGFAADSNGEEKASKTLQLLKAENRVVLEINPSYGCECFLIAQDVTLIPQSGLNNLMLW